MVFSQTPTVMPILSSFTNKCMQSLENISLKWCLEAVFLLFNSCDIYISCYKTIFDYCVFAAYHHFDPYADACPAGSLLITLHWDDLMLFCHLWAHRYLKIWKKCSITQCRRIKRTQQTSRWLPGVRHREARSRSHPNQIPEPPNLAPFMQRSRDYNLSSSQMTKLLTLSPRESLNTLQRKLVLATSMCNLVLWFTTHSSWP